MKSVLEGWKPSAPCTPSRFASSHFHLISGSQRVGRYIPGDISAPGGNSLWRELNWAVL